MKSVRKKRPSLKSKRQGHGKRMTKIMNYGSVVRMSKGRVGLRKKCSAEMKVVKNHGQNIRRIKACVQSTRDLDCKQYEKSRG